MQNIQVFIDFPFVTVVYIITVCRILYTDLFVPKQKPEPEIRLVLGNHAAQLSNLYLIPELT